MAHETVNIQRTRYDDPFFDQASSLLPKSIKKLLEACQTWALTNSTIAPLIRAAAEYPITSLVYTHKDEANKEIWKTILEDKIGIYEALFEIGLDHLTYGNAFVTISFPFIRFLKCYSCNQEFPGSSIKYEFRGYEFEGTCPSCKQSVQFGARDEFTPKPDGSGIRVVRLEPQLITPKYNRVTGETFYYYDIPRDIIRAVEAGDKEILDGLPIEYIETVKTKKKFKLLRIYHFKNPTISGRDMQWGFPSMLPSLKDLYLNQVYRKAEEMIGLEYAVPLRVLFPSMTTQDPLQKVSMQRFVTFMERSIRFWRRDKNAIITSPVPVSVTTIGAPTTYNNAPMRAKILEEAIGGMGFNSDWLTGQARYSSANVSLRIKENQFLSYARRIDRCLQWLCDEIKSFLSLPSCTIHMRPFKMADDVQMLQMLFSLAQMNKISWNTFLSRLDIKYADEMPVIMTEARDTGQHQGETQKALLEASLSQAAAQVEQEAIQGGYKQIMEGSKSRALPAAAQETGNQELAGVARGQRLADQDKEQQRLRLVRMEEAEVSKREAEADNIRSKIKMPKVKGKINGQNGEKQKVVKVKPDIQLESWAEELLQMDPKGRKTILHRIQQQSPEIYKAIVEKTQELASAEQGVEQLGAQSPKELAERIVMMSAREKRHYLVALQRQNPELLGIVLKLINTLKGGGSKSPKEVVDMRPNPDVLPARRKTPSM